MKVFAIGDLHLSETDDKPMGVFGPEWEGHDRKIIGNWRHVVGEDDIVLVVGDISWAMRLEDARADLATIGALPGRVVLLRGNHDYWWSAIGKVRAALPDRMWAIQNDCLVLDDVVFAGSRGWMIPDDGSPEEDWKISRRELVRLEQSLTCARKEMRAGRRLVTALHYPPILADAAPTGFTKLLEDFGADVCAYGHLHGEGADDAVEGNVRGVTYRMVACDAIDFTPVEL